MDYKSIDDFLASKPDIQELRKQYAKYPNIVNLLKGDFADSPPNRFPAANPKIASWVIDHGLDGKPRKNPTYGFMSVGLHEFDIEEYAEVITVLKGELELETRKALSDILPGESGDIPVNDHVRFVAKNAPVLYICEYERV